MSYLLSLPAFWLALIAFGVICAAGGFAIIAFIKQKVMQALGRVLVTIGLITAVVSLLVLLALFLP